MTPLDDCRAGRISPEVALARMLLAGADVIAIRSMLDHAHPDPTIDAIRHLVDVRAPALQALSNEVAETLASHDASGPTPAEGVARIAAFFDRAVRHSPEASVALYSLGDPEILAAATEEIVTWLTTQQLLHPEADVLDLGCGIGRIAQALAPRCRSVLGLDVSEGMVAEAAARLAPLPNVRIARTAGENLDALDPAAFDLILAVDSFPYIVQTGTALRHVQGAARALRPGGALCILNLSYHADPILNQADAATWCQSTGLHLALNGSQPFNLWDGSAFVLRRWKSIAELLSMGATKA